MSGRHAQQNAPAVAATWTISRWQMPGSSTVAARLAMTDIAGATSALSVTRYCPLLERLLHK